jgi:hypothetical protein
MKRIAVPPGAAGSQVPGEAVARSVSGDEGGDAGGDGGGGDAGRGEEACEPTNW